MADFMEFDALKERYASKRRTVFGARGMVCSSQALASQAGLDVLRAGGTAVDAAIAVSSCLTVLEPTSNGIGSCAFALIWDGKKLHGLASNGQSPLKLSRETLLARGFDKMPERGWETVMVPGLPAAWRSLHQKFGRLDFRKLFEAAVSYARDGYPVQPICSLLWERSKKTFTPYKDRPWAYGIFDTFFLDTPPAAGQLVKLPDHARTLEKIAETCSEDFYTGDISREITAFAQKTGGYIAAEDLAAFEPQWVEPLRLKYRGYEVCEIPPAGQGLVVLTALNILKHIELSGKEDPVTVHRQIEAMKMAFTDGRHYIADPRFMTADPAWFLSDGYGAMKAGQIGEEAALPHPTPLEKGGTVYFCAADAYGNMISMIQSNYTGFGSGVTVPGTGISLNSRGFGFNMDPKSDNCVAPGKKPYHTIIPGFLMKDGDAVGPFGCMGGFMQPQGQTQIVMNLIDFGLSPQEAIDAPRWQWEGGKKVETESDMAENIVADLKKRGHDISVTKDYTSFGRAQMIIRQKDGVLAGATESRADGCAAAW